MKAAINFVRGAVSKKDIVPALTHLHVYDGRVQAGNGRVCIDAPCPALAGKWFTVPLDPFLRAIDACDGEPSIDVQDARILVKSKKFKAHLPRLEDDLYPVQKSLPTVTFEGNLLTTFKIVSQFIATDATRPWACGMLLKAGRAFATNNVSLIAIDTVVLPELCNVPLFTVEELCRINQNPIGVGVAENNICFIYENSAWMNSTLFATDWPDFSSFLPANTGLQPIPEGLQYDIEKMSAFHIDPKHMKIILGATGVKTPDGDKGAAVEGYEFNDCAFKADQLITVMKAATHIDFTTYPKAVPFYNSETGLVGVIMGCTI
jgi:DNA polymerase III sliding clamp (beta) subunit (PCNA family)